MPGVDEPRVRRTVQSDGTVVWEWWIQPCVGGHKETYPEGHWHYADGSLLEIAYQQGIQEGLAVAKHDQHVAYEHGKEMGLKQGRAETLAEYGGATPDMVRRWATHFPYHDTVFGMNCQAQEHEELRQYHHLIRLAPVKEALPTPAEMRGSAAEA